MDAGEARPVACQILDISAGGMRMDCTRAFEVGEKLRVEVHMGDDNPSPFTFESTVRWRRDADEGRLAHGLVFTDLSQHLTERLILFLRAQPLPESDDR